MYVFFYSESNLQGLTLTLTYWTKQNCRIICTELLPDFSSCTYSCRVLSKTSPSRQHNYKYLMINESVPTRFA